MSYLHRIVSFLASDPQAAQGTGSYGAAFDEPIESFQEPEIGNSASEAEIFDCSAVCAENAARNAESWSIPLAVPDAIPALQRLGPEAEPDPAPGGCMAVGVTSCDIAAEHRSHERRSVAGDSDVRSQPSRHDTPGAEISDHCNSPARQAAPWVARCGGEDASVLGASADRRETVLFAPAHLHSTRGAVPHVTANADQPSGDPRVPIPTEASASSAESPSATEVVNALDEPSGRPTLAEGVRSGDSSTRNSLQRAAASGPRAGTQAATVCLGDATGSAQMDESRGDAAESRATIEAIDSSVASSGHSASRHQSLRGDVSSTMVSTRIEPIGGDVCVELLCAEQDGADRSADTVAVLRAAEQPLLDAASARTVGRSSSGFSDLRDAAAVADPNALAAADAVPRMPVVAQVRTTLQRHAALRAFAATSVHGASDGTDGGATHGFAQRPLLEATSAVLPRQLDSKLSSPADGRAVPTSTNTTTETATQLPAADRSRENYNGVGSGDTTSTAIEPLLVTAARPLATSTAVAYGDVVTVDPSSTRRLLSAPTAKDGGGIQVVPHASSDIRERAVTTPRTSRTSSQPPAPPLVPGVVRQGDGRLVADASAERPTTVADSKSRGSAATHAERLPRIVTPQTAPWQPTPTVPCRESQRSQPSPSVHIASVEVVIEAPRQQVADSTSPVAARGRDFASRHYLRSW